MPSSLTMIMGVAFAGRNQVIEDKVFVSLLTPSRFVLPVSVLQIQDGVSCFARS